VGNTYNIILLGTEQDDKLVAHWEYSKAYHGYVRYTTVHGAGGDDTLSVDPALAYDGVELDGDDGNDLLLDGEGNDTLSGGAGDDDIVAAEGKDVIDGGEGSDTLRTGGDLSRLTITGIEHLFAIYDVQIAGFDLGIFETIEMDRDASIIFREAVTFDGSKLVGSHLRLIGSMEDDFLDLSATTATVEMHGERGDDHLLAGSGEALLQGDGGDDELAAGSGNATIEGGNGNDDISGGVGKDMLDGGSGNDTINGGDGDDRISSGIGNDTVKGGDGDDQISGSSVGNKALYGGGGDDLFENLDDATGKVTLVGGQGNDTLRFHGDVSALHVSGIETLEITLKVDRNDFEQHLPIKASGDFLESFKHIFGDSHDPSVAAQIELTSSDFHWRDQHSSLFGDIYGTSHADEIDMSKARKY
jgi:Ca2+-binding RTX toxin-like protein